MLQMDPGPACGDGRDAPARARTEADGRPVAEARRRPARPGVHVALRGRGAVDPVVEPRRGPERHHHPGDQEQRREHGGDEPWPPRLERQPGPLDLLDQPRATAREGGIGPRHGAGAARQRGEPPQGDLGRGPGVGLSHVGPPR